MARIRSIKPEFFTDEDVASLPPLTRIAFVGLWTQADKAGRLEDRPARLKVTILPYDKIDFGAILVELEKTGFIIRYCAQGRRLIQIRSFEKHQRPHHTEADSVLPPPEPRPLTVVTPLTNGLTTPGGGKGMEEEVEKGMEKGKEEERLWTRFDGFWSDYPRKEAKAEARKAWKKLSPTEALSMRISQALAWQRESADWLREGGKFIPHPATYLNNRRWEDEPRESLIPESASPDLAANYIAAKRFAEKRP